MSYLILFPCRINKCCFVLIHANVRGNQPKQTVIDMILYGDWASMN